MATHCDLRIATPGSRFGYPIARTLGNALSASIVYRCAAIFGESLTREMLLTSRLTSAERAYAVGALLAVTDDLDAELATVVDGRARRLGRHAAGHQEPAAPAGPAARGRAGRRRGAAARRSTPGPTSPRGCGRSWPRSGRCSADGPARAACNAPLSALTDPHRGAPVRITERCKRDPARGRPRPRPTQSRPEPAEWSGPSATVGPTMTHDDSRRISVLLGLLFGLAGMGSSSAAIALPLIAEDLGVGVGQAAWTISLYALMLAVTTAVYGRVSDLVGIRGPLLVGHRPDDRRCGGRGAGPDVRRARRGPALPGRRGRRGADARGRGAERDGTTAPCAASRSAGWRGTPPPSAAWARSSAASWSTRSAGGP